MYIFLCLLQDTPHAPARTRISRNELREECPEAMEECSVPIMSMRG